MSFHEKAICVASIRSIHRLRAQKGSWCRNNTTEPLFSYIKPVHKSNLSINTTAQHPSPPHFATRGTESMPANRSKPATPSEDGQADVVVPRRLPPILARLGAIAPRPRRFDGGVDGRGVRRAVALDPLYARVGHLPRPHHVVLHRRVPHQQRLPPPRDPPTSLASAPSGGQLRTSASAL